MCHGGHRKKTLALPEASSGQSGKAVPLAPVLMFAVGARVEQGATGCPAGTRDRMALRGTV